MPVIHVNVWEGINQEKIEYIIKNITQVFVDIDVPAHAVSVIVHEVKKEHWGEGGETCAVKFKDIEP